MLKLVKAYDESDDIGRIVGILARHVVKEYKSIACDMSVYQIHVDMDIAAECASSTLLSLLANMSTKLDRTLPALLIADNTTDVITNNPTPLQVALGVLLRDSK